MLLLTGGRTVTFYSYKGGTGRSMALANVAWVLACSGRRVLVIDWDLEDPGLHRYFAPFLSDKDLTETEGLIDFVWDFTTEVMTPGTKEADDKKWFIPLADFRRYAVSLEYDFPSNGAIDFVPAGRHGGDYADRVGSFDWKKFYEKMGGGVFLETARNCARENYDYILIDSRTGVSDISGICTTHLPDLLIVCFTANNQSIKGTAAVAESVREQWASDPNRGGMSPRIYPLLTRVDGFERDRLDRRRELARAEFAKLLSGSEGLMELPYIPVYSYEETLAVFRDRPEDKEASLLPGIERLTALITDHAITRLGSPPKDVQRRRVLARFEGRDGTDFESVNKAIEASRYDVFISHTSSDKPAVEEIVLRLVEKGLLVFFDRQQFTEGTDWLTKVEAALAASSTVAIFIGPSGLGHWQSKELQIALERRSAGHTGMNRIVPVFLPGAEPDTVRLPLILRALNWVDFRKSLDEPAAFERLVANIRGTVPTRGAEESAENPYRGLKRFDEDSSRFFFGRELLVDQLLTTLRQALQQDERLLSVIGASGSGKSSLLRAGLIPRLREGALEGSDQWPIAICVPGSNPLESLTQAVLATNATPSNCTANDSLTEAKNSARESLTDASTLDRLARHVLGESAPGKRLVVFVDQFEEIVTLADRETRDAFVGNLLHSAQIIGGPVIILIALRADCYGECLRHPSLATAILKHQSLVGPLTDDELRQAIERPAQIVGCELEAGLVELLINDAKGQPGALPLLQAVMAELWERRNGRRLTVEAYQSIGGLTSVLSRRASEVLDGFDEKDRSLCRWIFLRLVKVGEGTDDTRSRSPLTELIPVSESPDRVKALVQKLTDARLVTVEQFEGIETVEIAHDALIKNWDVLRSWIESERSVLRIQHRLAEAAGQWEAHSRDPSYLYTGAKLGQALVWFATHRNELNSREGEFFAVSRKMFVRRRMLLVACSAMAVLTVVFFAVLSWQGAVQANADRSRLIVTKAELAKATKVREESQRETEMAQSELLMIMDKYQRAESLRLRAEALSVRQENKSLAVLLSVEALNAAKKTDKSLITPAVGALRVVLGNIGAKLITEEQLLDEAKKEASRNMTPEEWFRYLPNDEYRKTFEQIEEPKAEKAPS